MQPNLECYHNLQGMCWPCLFLPLHQSQLLLPRRGGRIFDPFRRSLSPFMVDAPVCTQNWFRNNLPISLQKTMDDV
ncbi:hypothetical protein ACSBR1_040189 [Camellia fascicularis]